MVVWNGSTLPREKLLLTHGESDLLHECKEQKTEEKRAESFVIYKANTKKRTKTKHVRLIFLTLIYRERNILGAN